MLQTIRDRSQGLIVAVIVGLISLTFVLWGVESYISEARRVVVAEVDGDEILLDEYQDALQRARRQAEAILGDQFNPDDWNSEAVKQRTLDALVDERLLAKLADAARLRMSDAQVARQLQQLPTFQEDGVFSRALYEQRVAMLGYSPMGFEQRLRSDMQQAQLRGGIAVSEFVTREETERVARLRAQKRDIGYAVIPSAAFEAEITVDEAAVEQHYAAEQERYRTPERVALEYLELSPAALAESVAVDDAALRQYYDANHPAYTAPAQRNVNHILIQVAKDADEAAVTAARERIEAALARARAGEDFEQLATELSDDTGSKTEGGETGLFPRGVMAPEFEEAAFALANVGDVSEPVRTDFGFHIIKLKQIDAGGLRPFDEVKAEVETAYRAQEAQKILLDQAEQFSNLVYEHPDSLDVAREALGMSAQRTEALTRDEIAQRFSDKLAAAVFETEVLVDGLNSEPVELPDGRIVAVRVLEHRPSAIPPLAEVRAQVEAEVREEALRERTEAAGQELLERLRGGGTVTELVKAAGYGWETVEGAGRESDKVNRAVLRAAFSLAVPDAQPAYTGIAIGKADYAVIRVANIVTPPASDLTESEIAVLRTELGSARSNLAWEDFLAALRAGSDVKVYRENL